MMSLPKVTSSSPPLDLKGKKKVVLLFSASWHEGCGPVEAVLAALLASASATAVDSSSQPDVVYMVNIDAEDVSDVAERYEVTTVPTVLFLQGETMVERLEQQSVEPARITVAFQKLLSATVPMNDDNNNNTTTTTISDVAAVVMDPDTALKQRLSQLIRSDTVMVFMKGTPMAPRCGFSRQMVEILQEHGVPFGSFDILMDDTVRQGLKTFSDWPTYPQIYVNGELQGGLDILKELAEQGNLAEQFNVSVVVTPGTSSTELSLNDKLSQLVNRSHVMLFMKGLPSAPKCGFSRQLVALLDEAGVPYDAFDILQDEQVRQGLKTYSNWPTFPQLYVKGELVGGLDICKELEESGDLLETLQQQ